MTVSKRMPYLWSLALVLCASFPSATGAERFGHEGEVWLKMSTETRQVYASAYVLGFSAGFGRGCEEGTKGVSQTTPGIENEPLRKCFQKGLDFPETNSMANSVTDFYMRYPSDRYLYITDVMEALGRGMTLEEIHKHASPIGVTPLE
ncbi:MAG: hypothetical protein ACLP1Y_00885 [Candidatus Acidiferrales bacterium]